MRVSINWGTPKSSMLMAFSLINQPFLGYTRCPRHVGSSPGPTSTRPPVASLPWPCGCARSCCCARRRFGAFFGWEMWGFHMGILLGNWSYWFLWGFYGDSIGILLVFIWGFYMGILYGGNWYGENMEMFFSQTLGILGEMWGEDWDVFNKHLGWLGINIFSIVGKSSEKGIF